MLVPRRDRSFRLKRLNDGAELEAALDDLPEGGALAPELAMIRQAGPELGFDLTLSTDLPQFSGMASEASMAVATRAILEEFSGRLIEKEALSSTVYDAHSLDPGLRMLHHEPFACALGGFTDVEIDGKVAVRRKFLVKESVHMTFEMNSVLAYAGGLPGAAPGLDEVYSACLSEAGTFTEAQHRMKATSQAARDSLATGDLRSFATFMNEDWLAYRAMQPAFLPERMDRLLQRGHEAGARGGKVCGLCGSALYFLCDDLNARRNVSDALRKEGCTILPFQVDELGVDVWRQPQPDS
jgi:galactokinase/mevalonate kinase-like predicted kinase